jgi:hypothetical protein
VPRAERPAGREREAPAALGVEQGAEDRRAVDARQAQPVDRAVSATSAAVRRSPIRA